MKNAKTKNILKFAGAGLAVTMLITACGSDSSPESGDTETINMSLDWNAYMAYHAPILLGIEEGIFEENGVAIGEITLPGGSGDAVSEIGAGRTDMGWVDLSTASAGMLQEVPITSVAHTMDVNATGLTALDSTSLEGIEDLKGMSIGSTPGGSDSTLIDAFLNANDLTKNDVDIVNLPGDGKFPALMTGDVDAISGQEYYYSSLIQQEGQEANGILYGELGLEGLLDHGFVANNQFMEDHPETITNFLASYREALELTINDTAAACEYVVEASEGTMTQDLCETQLDLWLPLTQSPDEDDWGVNTQEDWETTIHILTEYGDAEGERSVSSMFSNDFLQ